MKNVLRWGLIIFSISCIMFTVKQAHFLTPLKLNKIPESKLQAINYDHLKVIESNELDKTCYNGSIDNKIEHREYYIGVLNTLCKEYKVKDIKISVKKATGKLEKSKTLAGADGLNHLVFYYNTIKDFNPTKFDITHVINHEYIHILMFKNMANAYSVDYKSKELINSVSKSYKNLSGELLYPSEYAYDSPKEQIAEILGIYNTKRMVKETYSVTNFEQDLYNQFMLNV